MADDSIVSEILKTKEVCNRILSIMKVHDQNMDLLQRQINELKRQINQDLKEDEV